MKTLFRILTFVFVAIAISLFCAAMTASISYALPLNCPPGSKVIGIECFDEGYNNTTPWYRLNEGAAIASFPFWLVLSLVVVSAASRIRLPDPPPPPSHLNRRIQSRQDRDWLPTNCPHCGGNLSSKNVRWLGASEATCPYCGGTVKANHA